MKKIVVNISDVVYEKLKFEALLEKKSIRQIIEERILHKKFDEEVEEAYSMWIESEFNKISEDKNL